MKKFETHNTKTWQKVVLIFTSVIITLTLIEIFLNIVSFFYQGYISKNQKGISLDKDNSYRILCLGESTTAGEKIPSMKSGDISYPTILYKMLNSLNSGINFKVINDGIPGATTLTLLTRLESNLDTYKPNLVIIMIGTNDTGITVKYSNNPFSKILLFLSKLKVIKIFFNAPLKYFKYHASSNSFINKVDSFDYFYDRFGHYTIDINPVIFLKSQGLPLNNKNIKKSIFNFSNGRINDAIKEINNFLLKNDDISVKLFLAHIYYTISEFDKAINIYQDVLSKREDPIVYIMLARSYAMIQKYRYAEEIYLKALDKFNDNYPVNIAYLNHLFIKRVIFEKLSYPKNEIKAVDFEIEKIAHKAIQLKSDNLLGYFLLGKYYLMKNDFVNALPFFEKAFELEHKENYRGTVDFNEQPARYLVDCYKIFNKIDSAEEILNSLVRKNNNPAIYRHLALLYIEKRDYEKANSLFKKTEDIMQNSYLSSYRYNYRLICQKIVEHNIKLIVMEHPIRSIESLKKLLSGIDGIDFVSNELNFKDALKTFAYEELFIDSYAGDFGHCTAKGNALIAENLVPVILKKVVIKKNDLF